MLSCALSAVLSVLDPRCSPGQEKMVAHPRAEKKPLQHEYKQRVRICMHISVGVHLIILFWLRFSRYLLLFKYHFLQPVRNYAALKRDLTQTPRLVLWLVIFSFHQRVFFANSLLSFLHCVHVSHPLLYHSSHLLLPQPVKVRVTSLTHLVCTSSSSFLLSGMRKSLMSG